MKSKNTMKFSLGLVIAAIFVIGLITGFSSRQDGPLAPPSVSARVAADTTGDTPTNPIIVSSSNISITVVPNTAGNCWKYRFTDVPAAGTAPRIIFTSPTCIPNSTPTVTVPSTAPFINNTVYKVEAQTCIAANATARTAEQCGAWGAIRHPYFKIIVAADTTPPAAPSLDLNAADDTGSSNADNITKMTTNLTFSGAAEVGSTVRVYDGANIIGTIVASNGSWALDTSLVVNGVHNITAKATDVAGNISVASAISVTIDTVAPTNQNIVFPTSVSINAPTAGARVSSTFNIVSSGVANNIVWFAPAGTVNFVAGPTMTRSSTGTATSIAAPTTPGNYKAYVVDVAGNISAPSAATLEIKAGSVLMFPRLISTDIPGNVYEFKNNVWVKISSAPAPVVPTTPAIVTPARTGFRGVVNNIITSVTRVVNNLINNIVTLFTGKGPTTPTTQSIQNLEVVKVGPGASTMLVTVAPVATPTTYGINCGTTCLTQYNSATPLKVTVSNVSSSYGRYRFNIYLRDSSPTTHGAFYNFSNPLNSPPNSPTNCNPSSPTCTFNMPGGDVEIWIEPTSACEDTQQYFLPHWTSTTVSPTNVAITQVVNLPNIAAGTTYDAQITWGPSIPQASLYPIGSPKTLSTSVPTVTLTGNAIDTPSTPFVNLPAPWTANGKGGFVGISYKKTIPMPSGNPIITSCGGSPKDDPFWASVPTTLTIQKVTLNANGQPANDAQDFSFNVTAPPQATTFGQFALDTDPSSATPASSKLFSPVLPVLNYSISETVPAGWQATNFSCTGANVNTNQLSQFPVTGPATPSIGFTMGPAGTNAVCTFTNKKLPLPGTITIIKDVLTKPIFDGTAGATIFPFVSSSPLIGSFSLDLNTATAAIPQSKTFTVPAGSYTITEGPLPTGWMFGTNNNPAVNPDCIVTAGSTIGTPLGNPLTINLASGGNVSCTFKNMAKVVTTGTTCSQDLAVGGNLSLTSAGSYSGANAVMTPTVSSNIAIPSNIRYALAVRYNNQLIGALEYLTSSPLTKTFSRSAAYVSGVNAYQVYVQKQTLNTSTGAWTAFNIEGACWKPFNLPAKPFDATT